MMIDLHTHTARCGHAIGDVAEYVAAAKGVGVDIIALTDHLPLPLHLDVGGSYAMSQQELAAYVSEVQEAATRSSSPKVLLGIEADWLPEERATTASTLTAYPFDVVLGSVHFLDGWVFDDPDLVDSWEGRNVLRVWERYFEAVSQAAATGLFDVIAHVDLIKKFGHRPDVSVTGLYEELAAALAGSAVAVEVSSAGLRKPCAEIYPSEELLAALFRAGVPVTTSSDAHAPHEVGMGISEVLNAIARTGYDRIVYFEKREMREVVL